MENDEKNIQDIKDSIKDVMMEVEKNNNVRTIFGDPVHEKDLVIIPVASVNMRGGGGGGQGEGKDYEHRHPRKGHGKGVGLGYARKVQPLGYIEIKDEKAVFKPILDMSKLATLAIVAGVAGSCMVLRAFIKKNNSD